MTKFVRFVPLLLIPLIAIVPMSSCSRVEPGHVGIKVSNFGSSAGVSDHALGVGWYFTPVGTNIYEYPIYTSTYAWTKSSTEQSGNDEEFPFQDRNGLNLSADVSVAYRVDPVKAPILFQKYRIDMAGIVAGPLRNAVRSALNEEAAGLGIEEIYGPKKAALLSAVQRDVARYFEPVGLHVEQLYWASNIRVPDQVLSQINTKIANEQAALAAQANVATVKANADARIADAEGKAKASQIEGDALRANPAILRQRAIEKWDGKLPTYSAGSGQLPFITEK
ncbi:regulator of protease activity HflC (stomatin/prohibitin superfamily) [Sphingomonas sp. BE270]|jgi:regulator of protease activity HflC (stomatin/prohibitin superfamily)|uniref:SPFH domain-containing protein n=1 Tax=unclassified Sphingomonas TaxID=196159 RepID=UPI000AF2B8E3|nr:MULTISPECIES: SPFH domain-containing protein [unclassified Sphingomonas]MDR6848354.1 regulator of protease activity HflC (stomatin/prohibitin superfamily) [Sphingomonas sp. BE137]MDR7259016.1 regulator of protease activity HflC (stomatin/prohibitin superfamily) [Sphingomonas sp. BE270]